MPQRHPSPSRSPHQGSGTLSPGNHTAESPLLRTLPALLTRHQGKGSLRACLALPRAQQGAQAEHWGLAPSLLPYAWRGAQPHCCNQALGDETPASISGPQKLDLQGYLSSGGSLVLLVKLQFPSHREGGTWPQIAPPPGLEAYSPGPYGCAVSECSPLQMLICKDGFIKGKGRDADKWLSAHRASPALQPSVVFPQNSRKTG